MRRRQTGVALITVMLIVVVATVLAAQMATQQSLAVRRAASIFDNEQARQYAYGGEELAREILAEDFKQQPSKVTQAEDWASDKLQFDFDDGHVELKIEDLQGRLNINSLAGGEGAVVAQTRFASLFSHLGVEPMFLDRLIDWIDSDQSKRPLGAEDYDYLGLEHPYRAANHLMSNESEMRLLLDMDAKTYAAVAPYVCALPAVATAINVNTASAPVLQAIIPTLSDDAAEAMVSQRMTTDGYDNVEKFISEAAAPVKAGLGVQSSWFQVSVTARYRDRYAYLTSIIQRDPTDGSMRVVYRDLSKKIYPAVAEDQSTGTNNG